MQGTDRQAYDRGSAIFSPDGRLYQVEYAREAVGRGSPTVGVRTADGVALAAVTRTRSSLQVADGVEKLHRVADGLAVGTAGHVADARRLVDFARRQAAGERLRYGEPTDPEVAAKAIADHVQEATQSGGTRPFGAALLVAGVGEDGPALFETDPSGTPTAWRAAAIGGDSDAIREALADAYPAESLAAGVDLALRALAAESDDGFAPEDVSVGTVDASGVESYDRDRRATALAEAGVAAS